MTDTRSVLIADDEPLARERIRRLVEAVPGYRVCGEAADGDSCLKQVAELEPDILLLLRDILCISSVHNSFGSCT